MCDFANLTFESPDYDKFPLLGMAFDAIRRGGNIPCALNAANEIAVAAFLAEKIGFMEMPELVAETIARCPYVPSASYDDLVSTNAEMRRVAEELIK